MLASISLVLGILTAVIVLNVTRRREPEETQSAPQPSTLGWVTLAFGLIAVTALAMGAWLSPQANNSGLVPFNLSIILAFAAVIIGIGTLKRHERHWITWVGLAVGLIPAIFWIIFALGNIFSGG
jgi:hypothetical protein